MYYNIASTFINCQSDRLKEDVSAGWAKVLRLGLYLEKSWKFDFFSWFRMEWNISEFLTEQGICLLNIVFTLPLPLRRRMWLQCVWQQPPAGEHGGAWGAEAPPEYIVPCLSVCKNRAARLYNAAPKAELSAAASHLSQPDKSEGCDFALCEFFSLGFY